MISGIFTAVLMIAFLAIVGWAWSSRNRDKFDKASRLPLGDEPKTQAASTRSRKEDRA